MKIVKKIIGIVLLQILLLGNTIFEVKAAQDICSGGSVSAECPSRHFADLDLTLWYHPYIDYVVSRGYMVGNGENSFGAVETTTRAMVVTILYSMSGDTVSEEAIRENKFTDVPDYEYYEKPVAWAKSNGIVAGFSETEFRPNQNITREQMLLMLQKYAEHIGIETTQRVELNEFVDVSSVSQWAMESMQWAHAISMISGIPKEDGNYLEPQGQATRAEVATFIKAFCEYNESIPTNIAECTIKNDEEDYILSIKVKGLQENLPYYIIQTDFYDNQIISDFEPIVFEKDIGSSIKTIEVRYTREQMRNLIMDKFVVAKSDEEGNYQAICSPVEIDNLEIFAENKEDYTQIVSKKGLQGVGFDVAADTNSKHTLFNLDLAKVVGNGPADGYSEYVYKGNTYYFSDCSNLVGEFKNLNQGYDQYIQGTTGEKNKVAVSLCLLLSYDSVNNYLIDPAARTPGYRYYTLNVGELEARETLEAVFLYLGELFGQEDCYVTNWILGNEVNSSRAYNYSGSLDFDTYIECYATAFRLLYNGVKAQKTANNVYISLDNGWTAAPDTYSGKATLDKFAECINQIDSNVEWNVAYHGYSYPLTRNDFWNDTSNTTFDFSTRYISMKNISVLTDYVAVLEEKYNKENERIRVILSEQGYNASSRDDVKAESQARALARGYYMAEFNDRVDAFIIRAIIDDEEEMKGGLFFGLKNWQDIKRITFYTYEFMDSSLEKFGEKLPNQIAGSIANQEKVGIAQEILCGSNWESMVPGFSRSKLDEMK